MLPTSSVSGNLAILRHRKSSLTKTPRKLPQTNLTNKSTSKTFLDKSPSWCHNSDDPRVWHPTAVPWLCLAVAQDLRADRGSVSSLLFPVIIKISWMDIVDHDFYIFITSNFIIYFIILKSLVLIFEYTWYLDWYCISWLILLFMNVLSIKAIQCQLFAPFYSILSETSVHGETPVLSDVSLMEAPGATHTCGRKREMKRFTLSLRCCVVLAELPIARSCNHLCLCVCVVFFFVCVCVCANVVCLWSSEKKTSTLAKKIANKFPPSKGCFGLFLIAT